MIEVKLDIPPGLLLLGQVVRRRLAAVIQASAQNIKGTISPYPASSQANAPKSYPGRWYQRGYGPRWARKDGTTGGRKTSETLNRRWSVKKGSGGFSAIIGNNASYSRYVHAEENQARFHSMRGWVTDEQAIERNRENIQNDLSVAIQNEIERLTNE